VQDINWRATHLRKWDKTSFVIPNGQLAKQSFTNLRGARHPFAPWYTVNVSGDYHPDEVIELLRKAIEKCNIPLPAPAPVVRLMSADSTPYTYMVWLHFADYPTMFAGRDELYREIDSVLRAAGIDIAAEIHEVRYRKSETATHNAAKKIAG
jgi:small-conductance mechanosensitive channel